MAQPVLDRSETAEEFKWKISDLYPTDDAWSTEFDRLHTELDALAGYKGRLGIYEIFLVGEEIQHLIYTKCSADVIRDAARKGGMMTLREDGLRKAAAGTTTLSEVIATTIGDAE